MMLYIMYNVACNVRLHDVIRLIDVFSNTNQLIFCQINKVLLLYYLYGLVIGSSGLGSPIRGRALSPVSENF
jgi:hypothetical protein